MTQLCRKIVHVNLRWNIFDRVSIIREFFKFMLGQVSGLFLGKPAIKYPEIAPGDDVVASPGSRRGGFSSGHPHYNCKVYETDADLVSLKSKYVGDEQEQRYLQMTGVTLMDKTLIVQGARISFSLWDVGGDQSSMDHVPIACKDAVAIFFMFDLTSRCTLNSVVGWYTQARKWNQTAIPILIGTKFDDFVRLPPDLQWTIVTQVNQLPANFI
ncbi:septum-promoting GTP-binding protein 1 [Prunus yedoensis var. nudiflora]|uniref:Septum-promoting GTP-binding protein 1 n=1 Tax=Prunus yedoensis var. nudiflora TaxID=2094558 RepID=A0A314YPN6_PRUYE|nr:septum-promoting GTP-binding protein 1 [Prunus yedoensis var. nudiflora]